jgi:hypothetical protein
MTGVVLALRIDEFAKKAKHEGHINQMKKEARE